MFGFFKKKKKAAAPPLKQQSSQREPSPLAPRPPDPDAPVQIESNPGVGSSGQVGFSNGGRSWEEVIDVVATAADVLAQLGHEVVNRGTWLSHPESGFRLLPMLAGFQLNEEGRISTTTTMQVNHPTFAPRGVFEYQHWQGVSVSESIATGFEQWAKTDWVTLLDAVRPKLQACTAMELAFPASDGRPARIRRAVFGPVAHFRASPPPATTTKEACAEGEEHAFCPCCLLTQSFEAFKELIESDDLHCLRLFAAREPDGTPQADCRVNGEDFEQGAEALRAYAKKWEPAGYEFRKQYVILHNHVS